MQSLFETKGSDLSECSLSQNLLAVLILASWLQQMRVLQPRSRGTEGQGVPTPAALARGCSPEPQAATVGAVAAQGSLWDAFWVLEDRSAPRWRSQVSGRCPVGLCSYQRTSALCLPPPPTPARSGHPALPCPLWERGKARLRLQRPEARQGGVLSRTVGRTEAWTPEGPLSSLRLGVRVLSEWELGKNRAGVCPDLEGHSQTGLE